jgi:hypothetical protein
MGRKKPRRRVCPSLHDGTTLQDRKNEAFPPTPLCLNIERFGIRVDPEVDCKNCLSKGKKSKFLFGIHSINEYAV